MAIASRPSRTSKKFRRFRKRVRDLSRSTRLAEPLNILKIFAQDPFLTQLAIVLRVDISETSFTNPQWVSWCSIRAHFALPKSPTTNRHRHQKTPARELRHLMQDVFMETCPPESHFSRGEMRRKNKKIRKKFFFDRISECDVHSLASSW
jgi:hypothetical protein